METKEEFTAKQYPKIELTSAFLPKLKLDNNYNFCNQYPNVNFQNYEEQEPIDLTYSQRSSNFFDSETNEFRNYSKNVFAPSIYSRHISKTRQRRSRIYRHQTLPGKNQLNNLMKDVLELQTTESKQEEIIKAAKSLFSKRTRTLYHWMYPNTPKQQIKLAVTNSWETLSSQEKQFYISQVLVKFGFGQCDLMVNPQLGGIKELPPLPDTFIGNNYSNELQTAISSISCDNSGDGVEHSERKRKQGRPFGSKNKNKSYKNEAIHFDIDKNFQDDPELSRELERFDITFDQV